MGAVRIAVPEDACGVSCFEGFNAGEEFSPLLGSQARELL